MDFTKRLDRPVVLVGLMGVGKSTVGRRLARRLGLEFIDSDSEIEETVGLPWGELFERYGEADYRDGERRLVARLVDGTVRVIATGGGVFVGATRVPCSRTATPRPPSNASPRSSARPAPRPTST